MIKPGSAARSDAPRRCWRERFATLSAKRKAYRGFTLLRLLVIMVVLGAVSGYFGARHFTKPEYSAQIRPAFESQPGAVKIPVRALPAVPRAKDLER
jgi:hypothetical protein